MWKKHSSFFRALNNEKDRESYLKKLTLQNGKLLQDPFNIDAKEWSTDVKKLPDITYPDIWNYLIETPSEFTKDKLKAFKSLEAFCTTFLCQDMSKMFIFMLLQTVRFHL